MTKKTDVSIILERRAQVLAAPTQTITRQSRELVLCFYVNNEKYALEEKVIYKVIPYQPVTELPMTHHCFEGVLYYAGHLWPVIDTAQFFQKQRGKQPEQLILLENDHCRLALSCHRLLDQVTFSRKEDMAELTTEQMDKQDFIHGVLNHDVALINAMKLLCWLEESDINQSKGEL